MVVLKSIFAGMVAVVVAMLLALMGIITWGWWNSHRAQSEGVGAEAYDLNSPWIMIVVPLIVGVVFFVGVYWEYRRAPRTTVEHLISAMEVAGVLESTHVKADQFTGSGQYRRSGHTLLGRGVVDDGKQIVVIKGAFDTTGNGKRASHALLGNKLAVQFETVTY